MSKTRFLGPLCAFVIAASLPESLPALASDAINPGDQLIVTVYNHPELSGQVRVDSRGGISIPLAGYFIVSGLDLRSVDELVAKKLVTFVKFPAVDVQSVGESQFIFVAGGPGGVLPFSPGETLSTAISDMEKSLENKDPSENNRLVLTDVVDQSRLDLRRVSVDRSGRILGVFDTVAMRGTGDPGPMLHANDTIVFRNKPIPVYVSGYVAKPGPVYLDPDEQLSDALDQAGGTLPTAATSHIELTASDSTRRLVALGDPVFSEPASAGEVVLVPVAPRVQVNGLVARPGPVTLQHDFTVLGAINSAGGINKFANIKDVQVVRNGSVTSYDLTRLTYGDLSQNPTLQDGDSVFLPEGHKIDFTTVFSSFFNIAGLRGLL